jgi:hypothetical protein
MKAAVHGFGSGRVTMDIAIVFDWFAQDSILAAELTTDPMPT